MSFCVCGGERKGRCTQGTLTQDGLVTGLDCDSLEINRHDNMCLTVSQSSYIRSIANGGRSRGKDTIAGPLRTRWLTSCRERSRIYSGAFLTRHQLCQRRCHDDSPRHLSRVIHPVSVQRPSEPQVLARYYSSNNVS